MNFNRSSTNMQILFETCKHLEIILLAEPHIYPNNQVTQHPYFTLASTIRPYSKVCAFTSRRHQKFTLTANSLHKVTSVRLGWTTVTGLYLPSSTIENLHNYLHDVPNLPQNH